jgi:hypothetical protein
MKKFNIVLALIIFLLAGITFAQEAFEGKVIFEVQEEDNKQVMDYYAKDKRFRMDMPEEGGSIVFDSQALKMYVIMDEQKMYMESQMMPLSMGGAGSVNKTGDTKTILGYDCEKFVFEQEDLKGEAWMTKELGAFMFFMESQQEMPAWQSEVLDAGYFPLQVTQFNKRENSQSVYNVIEVTPMELSSDLFVPPANYQKLDLMNMGGFENLMGK